MTPVSRERPLSRVRGGESFPDGLHYKVFRLPDVSLITVQGEIDLANAHVFGSALSQLSSRGLPVLVDLTKIQYIDSTGIHALLRAHEQCRTNGVPFAVATNRLVQRICAAVSLDHKFRIFANIPLARGHFAARRRPRDADLS
jgi:anti-anti-sigma factor